LEEALGVEESVQNATASNASAGSARRNRDMAVQRVCKDRTAELVARLKLRTPVLSTVSAAVTGASTYGYRW
jgi:hypothetical protein